MSAGIKAAVLGVFALLGGYFLFGDPQATFRSSDGKWADTEYSSKGRSFEVVVANFERYKLQCGAPDAQLRRATPELWFDVFAWPSYLNDRKWKVPYSGAHPETGNYYPPVTEKDCHNEGASGAVLDAAKKNGTQQKLRGARRR